MPEKLTREQAAIVGAFTGYLCGPFSDVHATIERVMGRPVWTHEMGSSGGIMEEVRERMKAEFLAICAPDTPMPNEVAP